MIISKKIKGLARIMIAIVAEGGGKILVVMNSDFFVSMEIVFIIIHASR